MGKGEGGAGRGRTAYSLRPAAGGAGGALVMPGAGGQGPRAVRRRAVQAALRNNYGGVQRLQENEEGRFVPTGTQQRVRVKVSNSKTVKQNAVGIHAFNVDGGIRTYSRSTYKEARRRATADAASQGVERIRYLGTYG